MNRRSNNNNTSNNNNNRYQAKTENRTIGVVEFYDVRDSPKDGRELRLTFRQESSVANNNNNSNNNNNNNDIVKTFAMTIKPQLGPRKTDPLDPTPQFDQSNRLTVRLRPREIATLLFWLQGRGGGSDAKKNNDSVEVAGSSYRVELARNRDAGTLVLTMVGTKLDRSPGEPLSYELQPHQQVQFAAFLENSLYSFWNIAAF